MLNGNSFLADVNLTATANNQITGASLLGAVGWDWQLGGFAVDPPTSMGDSSRVAQLVQEMAGFGGGSGRPRA
jgi:hypothetical protein